MSKLSLPFTSITVGGWVYPLRALTPKECEQFNGLCDREEPIYIGIDPDIKGRQLTDTVLHEVLHAIMWERSITHNLNNVVDLEEYIVTSLATGIIEVLRTNPKLTEWIREAVKDADSNH